MIEVLAIAVALLVAVGVGFLLDRSLFRAIIGISLLAHAANLIVLAAGGEGHSAPILGRESAAVNMADPLPQALVLTAIVISMAVTLYLLGLLRASSRSLHDIGFERPLPNDDARDPVVVAKELRAGGARD